MRRLALGAKASEPRYYVGVDLGQSRDPTGRVDLPRPVPEKEKPKPNYARGKSSGDKAKLLRGDQDSRGIRFAKLLLSRRSLFLCLRMSAAKAA